MIDNIPEEILSIYKKIKENGFDVFFVGGCVRDLLLGQSPKDWDMASNATPQQIQSIFDNSFYDNRFGTVGIPLQNPPQDFQKKYVEITTFRSEKGYSDRRRPDEVVWGKSIEEDLARRDFTVNAIAIKINFVKDSTGSQTVLDYEIIDPFYGQKDLKNKIIKAVGNPYARFQEDALRLIRAIRFACELGFEIEQETWKALVKNARLISFVSFERIRDELLKILASDFPYEGIRLLDASGLLEIILPEITKGKGVSQARPGRHHKTDVFTHNLLSLKFCPSKDPIVRLATLLHDVGKPFVVGKDEKGLVTFYNHEIVGAKIAREIAGRLRLSKKDREKIVTLVRWHMFTVDEKATDAAIRRFIRRVGVENIRDMLDLRVADRLGSGAKPESWRLALFRKRIEDQLKPKPFSLNDLAVNGYDVMETLNIKPGPKVGQILQKLFEEVDEDLSKNTREYLLKRIKELGEEDKNP